MLAAQENLSKDGNRPFVFGHEYKVPAQLHYYSGRKLKTYAANILGRNGLQFNIWHPQEVLETLEGRDALFVYSDAMKPGAAAWQALDKYFQDVDLLEKFEIKHKRQVIRSFYIYHCQNYRLSTAL